MKSIMPGVKLKLKGEIKQPDDLAERYIFVISVLRAIEQRGEFTKSATVAREALQYVGEMK